ncbi:MAG: hypothetical protein U0S50_05020 [Sphingopyxis sp.]|uniref:hypothetical protein n=1 Tax=Sphingopyxis sp. TaxID=1908224 RepID=UPI002AB85D45|nr:hypothetical protein [Sphingopyxis sp.]MDZ3831164.1 hypothetical protein [Sphingopyxis sp.]
MLVTVLRIFPMALGAAWLVAAPAAPSVEPTRAPFDAVRADCEDFRGATICSYQVTKQRGDRVCGIQRYFATNAYYYQRFVATVDGDVARIAKICGDPGSETDTYCRGQAPDHASKVGWGTSDALLVACEGGRYDAKSGKVVGCTAEASSAPAHRETDLPALVDDLDSDGPDTENLAWLKRCVAGQED